MLLFQTVADDLQLNNLRKEENTVNIKIWLCIFVCLNTFVLYYFKLAGLYNIWRLYQYIPLFVSIYKLYILCVAYVCNIIFTSLSLSLFLISETLFCVLYVVLCNFSIRHSSINNHRTIGNDTIREISLCYWSQPI